MLKIDRHTIDEEDVNWHIKSKERLLKTAEKVARTKPEKFPLSTLATDTQDYLSYLSALEPDSLKICPLLHATVQAATALFLQSLSVGEHIQVTIMGDVAIDIPTTGSSSTTNAGKWLRGFFAAMIRRDIEALNVLVNIPLEIMRNSSTKSDEYVFLYVDALQALWRNEKDLGTRLVNALEATDPEKLERGVDYALAIVVPALNLLLQLLKNDVPQLNHVLYSALEDHKKFWSVNEMRSRE
jgi:Immunity protein 49